MATFIRSNIHLGTFGPFAMGVTVVVVSKVMLRAMRKREAVVKQVEEIRSSVEGGSRRVQQNSATLPPAQ